MEMEMSSDTLDELFRAAVGNQFETLNRYNRAGANLQAFKNDITIMHLAAMNGDSILLEYLLGMGKIDVNIRTLELGMTSLHIATLNDHVNVAKMLLNHGAHVNASTRDYQRPIHFAVLNGNTEMIRMLIDNEADLNVYDKFSHSPLSIAVLDTRNLAITEVLLKSKASPKLIPPMSLPLLYDAILNYNGEEYLKILIILCQYGAHINYLDPHGRNALHYAAINGSTLVAKVLCRFNCYTNRRDKTGTTPIQMARNHGHQEFVKCLLDHNFTLRTNTFLRGRV